MNTTIPPRFVPTLTEVVEPTPTARQSPGNLVEQVDNDRDGDPDYDRLLAYCQQQVEERIARIAQDIFDNGIQQLREQLHTQLEAIVRQAIPVVRHPTSAERPDPALPHPLPHPFFPTPQSANHGNQKEQPTTQ